MELRELNGAGWTKADPPMVNDGGNVIARVQGTPINGGVKMETIESTHDTLHERYSTGPYRVDLRIAPEAAQVKVVRDDGY